MKYLIVFILIIATLFGCSKPPIPQKLIAYERIVSAGDEGIGIVAYDLASNPYSTYLLITDVSNNIHFEKALGDSLIFTDSIDLGESFILLLKNKKSHQSLLMNFDYNGKLLKQKEFNIQGIELLQLTEKNLLICGNTAENETGYMLLKPNWDIIITNVLPGNEYRSCVTFKDEPYFVTFNSADKTCGIYTKNNDKLYSYSCSAENPSHLTVNDDSLRLHWLDSNADIHIISFDEMIKVTDETLVPTGKATNFSVVEKGNETFYTLLMIDKEIGGASGTKLYKLSPQRFQEIKPDNPATMTLASFYQKNNQLMLCFFSLTAKGNQNGFFIIE
ncbi:MAG: hypothetical protein JXR56_04330 [Candidatus Cloacimonetes bacterium]|nr:hypothetical protein [Candidatus Cloacimonadota bacterium]